MSRVYNADDSLLQFRQLKNSYDKKFVPIINTVRAKFGADLEEEVLNQCLEFHLRAYYINSLLAALNWRLDLSPENGLPNLIPEAPVRSDKRNTTRFMDYLGLENDTQNPLLIVETKNPGDKLPSAQGDYARYSNIICDGLNGTRLSGSWNDWLSTLKDYVVSCYNQRGSYPERVVITNGIWLVLFLNPFNAFALDPDAKDLNPNKIIVFLDSSDLDENYSELFRYLEFSQISKKLPILNYTQLPFYIDRKSVNAYMHGLILRYIEEPGIYNDIPRIKVAPIIVIRSTQGNWLKVESNEEFEIPNKEEMLKDHLTIVDDAAKKLLTAMKNILKIADLESIPIESHYGDSYGFKCLPGIVEIQENQYIVITGEYSHYLKEEPSVHNCPFHTWEEANKLGVAVNAYPISSRNVSERSFFISGENHHCAHMNVRFTKSAQITTDNRNRCGSRSGSEGQAFCEVWQYEKHLCCRTCVFETVCTKSEIFNLPCTRN